MVSSAALIRTVLNAGSVLAPGPAGRAAFELFRRPVRRGRIRSTERELHRRAHTEQLTVNGKQVVAYRWGDGTRPVLMLHGWQSRASRFTGFVPQLLALGMSPVAFDAPGHGDSSSNATTILEYRELIGRLQDRYGTFEAVIAHSFGVSCAFFALRDGIRAERLVAISGVVRFRYLVDGFCAILGLNRRIERELTRRIERELFPGTEALWERFDASHRPEDITVPVLVIHDEDDDVVPLGQARLLEAAYGDRVDMLITRGLGHRRILAEPTVIDNAIGFLAAASTPSATATVAPPASAPPASTEAPQRAARPAGATA